jgi:hypothetical protein
MSVEPLPPNVERVTTGYASLASGVIEEGATREREQGDVRTKCPSCPAFVDGKADAGQRWLIGHKQSFHGAR